MKLIISYIKRHIAILSCAVVSIGLFALVFGLHDIPIWPIGYATLLSAVATGIVGVIRFTYYWRRKKRLEVIKRTITLSEEKFPSPMDKIEEDYQDIIRILVEKYQLMQSAMDKELLDRMDYYTMWVHQIKTPIAAMNLLLQTETDSDKEELMEQLFKIEQYVSMVLEYLRMESSDLVLSHCDMDKIIKQGIKKHAKSFIRKKIGVQYEEIHKTVLTDERWMVFVIEQILSNGLKYTEKGSISIYLEGDSLVIEDTGIGIREEDLPRICEKGYTGYNGRADKKSTGIGLYLCKRILDKLSHPLTITSKLSEGTKVTIGLEREELDTR